MESFSTFLLRFAQREDSIFYFTLFLSAASVLAAEVFWLRRRLKNPVQIVLQKKLPPDDARFEIFWTLIPVLILVALAFVEVEGLRKSKSPTPASSSSVPVQVAGIKGSAN